MINFRIYIFDLYIKVWIREFDLQFFFSSQREFYSVPNIDFLLNYDLFYHNWSYQGQNYHNVPQVF